MDYLPASKIHGIPDAHEGFSQQYYQGNTNECAIYAQWNVLRDYGVNIDEKHLVEQAKFHGWFTDEGGTPVQDLGKLLELNGVQCDMIVDGNRYNLINELAQGKRVIVTVDSGELWRENTVLARLWEGVKDVFGSGEDHALVVSGIDTTDPNNVQVVLTDSGTGHHTISYPIDQFEDAWADGDCKMIVTRNPPSPSLHLPSMLNFDYDLGHIPMIGDTEFSVWQDMHSDNLDNCSITPIGNVADVALQTSNVEPDILNPGGELCELLGLPPDTAVFIEDIDDDGNVDKVHIDVDGDDSPDITLNINDDDVSVALFGEESNGKSELS